jgi:hypothetical protein
MVLQLCQPKARQALLAALSYGIALPLIWQQIAICLAISLSEEMLPLTPYLITRKSSGQRKIKGVRRFLFEVNALFVTDKVILLEVFVRQLSKIELNLMPWFPRR